MQQFNNLNTNEKGDQNMKTAIHTLTATTKKNGVKKITLVSTVTLVFAFLSITVFGQKQKEYLSLDKQYSVAKIYKKNFKTLKVSSLTLINDSTISFKNSSSKNPVLLSVEEVRYFSVKNGTKALRYGLWGAGFGAFTVMIASLKVAGDSDLVYKDNLGARIAIIVGGCAAVGAGIGALVPKWKRLYVRKNNSTTSFIFYPAIYKDHYCVGLTVNF